ncbi:cell wall hydrolase [Paenibacillus tianjinensis]|uniref:Cell wall hydrolase n=1 Tax=Paenibacillus tianjinensis TaxID=2810347 RepID=A0ABX7LCH8_9BACL|nr:cell wall hydrolase [Paenibacillus tianjinensis]QSF45845.1 cell wall hydrolase [Paenibacillus tianjinensis]
MEIFKQNRCIALLVGVILVCFSAISLLSPGKINEGQNTLKMDKFGGSGHASAAALLPQTAVTPERIKGTAKPMLFTTAAIPGHVWNGKQTVDWFTPAKLKLKAAAGTQPAKPRTVVVKVSPEAQQALKQAAVKGSQSVTKVKTASQQHPPTKLFFSRTKLLSQEQQAQATWSYAISEEDLLLLQKIVMAEAEGEPYQGKVAVANVVLNRLRSANFPDTIHEVIYQKSQFSPVANGRLQRVKPNEDSIKAVNAALSGVKEVTDDTYFFLSLKLAQDLTVHHSRTYAKTIGNHTFYK